MNDLAQWQKANERYLATVLERLRLRLEEKAQALTKETPPASSGRFFKRKPQVLLAPPEEQLGEADPTIADEKTLEPPPALIMLQQRFGLSSFEHDILLLCAAMELDTRIASLCAQAQDDPHRPYPTFALALALFDDPSWDALSPQRPLRYWQLIEINQPGAQPLTTSALRADERIVNYIKGLNYLDDRLAPLLTPLEGVGGERALPPSQHAVAETIVRHLEQAAQTRRAPVIQLLGTDPLSKQLVAEHATTALGLHLYRLPAEMLPTQAAELETLARLWQRESILLPVALYVDAHEGELSHQTGGPGLPLNRFLSRSGGLFFLDTRDIRTGFGGAALALDITKPTPAEQRATWEAVLDSNAAESPTQLAGQFNLNLGTIYQTAQTVQVEGAENGYSRQEKLWDVCLTATRPRLDTLAQRLDPKATWEDIVLPHEEMSVLHQITAQVAQRTKVYDEWGFRDTMNRGLGINALFAGESGTGKTMAAEVIANALRLNLYRIDLSTVVSKYIGETEKNLRRLFDAAEDGGAVLFFDEADALFGKRSEVKDSHDRYANIEINYLLQRIESYCGLAILATNMKSALDQAFLRRLRFIVNFPFPGITERKAIWQKVFPAQTPTCGVDYGRLAKLNLSGGSIHNIALNAAFLAAQDGGSVTMPLILEAARGEFRKLEKPINEADFRWTQPVGVAA